MKPLRARLIYAAALPPILAISGVLWLWDKGLPAAWRALRR